MVLGKPGVVAFLFIAAIALTSGCSQKPVEPEAYEVELDVGEADNFDLKVSLRNAPPSLEPLDVLLVFDATGSMSNVISEVREGAQEIVGSVRGLYKHSAFGLALFTDYGPGITVWQLRQDLTTDTSQILFALGNASLIPNPHNGDAPEPYARALYETLFASWRKDARRYVILFGDAPAHDPTFYTENYGIDPGRDESVGTEDDLSLVDVVNKAKKAGITVITVYDKGGWFTKKPAEKDAIKGFEYIAKETGGLSKAIGSATEVVEAIKAGVRDSYRPAPGLFVSEEFRDWVKSPVPMKREKDSKRYKFSVTLRAPDEAKSGIYKFPLIAVHGGLAKGGEIGKTSITIRVTDSVLDWRWIALMAYLLFLFLLVWMIFFQRKRRGGGIRYLRNRQPLALLAGIVFLAVFLVLIPYIFWYLFPEEKQKIVTPSRPGEIVSVTGPIKGSYRR
ncbi:MAG TPA: VWA domain-containing protein [Gammaproteobacteria bacterium]|nr:VWA domain-containing protein [Gammaproteobacteria bacterium]